MNEVINEKKEERDFRQTWIPALMVWMKLFSKVYQGV